jgi:hypothetical protein
MPRSDPCYFRSAMERAAFWLGDACRDASWCPRNFPGTQDATEPECTRWERCGYHARAELIMRRDSRERAGREERL